MSLQQNKQQGLIEQELYIVRHGETDLNRSQIVQGRGVDTSLNENGIRQAHAFFNHFGDTPFDIIFTSQLQRTHQTMQPFVDKGYKLNIFAELDEIDWGIHEGRVTSADMKSEYQLIVNRWNEGYLNEKIPGGESPLELQARQKDFINNILPQYSGKILICMHGRAMRSFICTLLNKPLVHMDDYPHQNLSLYKLNRIEGIYNIEFFNYLEHLNGKD